MNTQYNPRPVTELDDIRLESAPAISKGPARPGRFTPYALSFLLALSSPLGTGCTQPTQAKRQALNQYYESIDLNNLTQDERKYIEDYRRNNPDGKLNLEEITERDRKVLEPWLSLINVKKPSDKDLVTLYRIGIAINNAVSSIQK